ncbi:MAG: nucleoside 2-deoxyribosyltransferase [Spirochaetes bacterium]|nr:nucleoside 2-deoxyribosyltransferase [Spirochaetota bacterium]
MNNNYEIYCAGPLFNDLEKKEMELISYELEKSGFKTFLPHRDGLEYASIHNYFNEQSISSEETNSILSKAIFALDVYKVITTDGLILNMNGRVPDEGAMVEAGIAWSNNKKIVIYKNDSRSMLNGNDNPLVVGLSEFNMVSNYCDIPIEFNKLFENDKIRSNNELPSLNSFIEIGKEISGFVCENRDYQQLCKLLVKCFGNSKMKAG